MKTPESSDLRNRSGFNSSGCGCCSHFQNQRREGGAPACSLEQRSLSGELCSQL